MAHHRVGNNGSPPPPTPPQDLISALPQHIIHHIFTFLQAPEPEPDYDLITRLSVVSKQFLSFSRTFPHVKIFPSDASTEQSWWSSCLDSVSRNLMRFKHNEGVPLQRLTLRVFKFGLKRDDRIDSLLQHALANCVGDVIISMTVRPLEDEDDPFPTKLLRLPESAPPCVCRTLSLGQFKVDLQALLSGSPYLEQLDLTGCAVLGKDVTVSSPTLKILRLWSCWSSEIDGDGGNFLVLQAPNLKKLTVGVLSELVRIEFGSCKRLLELELLDERKGSDRHSWDLYEDEIRKLPSLETLELSYLRGSEHIIISSLSLKNLSLWNLSFSPHATVGAIWVDAPELESLHLYEICRYEIHGCRTLHITPSQNLRRIVWTDVWIDASWLKWHLSDFPLLQELCIRCAYNNKHMKRVNISHARLSKLTIDMTGEDVKISINTPRLLHCTLDLKNPLPAITDLKCPPSLNIYLHIRWGKERNLERSWKLWQLLEAFSGCKCITLAAFSGNESINLPEDLAFRHEGISGLRLPFSEIKLLQRPKDDDGLEKLILLCCHPKMLNFCYSKIKFHYEEDTDDPHLCEGHLVVCWRRCLKGVTLVNFKGNQSRLRNFFIENAEISNECIRQVSQ